MNIRRKKIGSQTYLYLEHSLREKNKVLKKELYLGLELPPDIEKIKSNFLYNLLQEKYFNYFDQIKYHFADELKDMPPTAREKYLNYFIIKFTYDSNRIEGSTITLKETAKILEQGIAPLNKPIEDIKETEAHRQVFQEMMKHQKNLTLPIILYWHKLLFQHTKPDIAGKIRTHHVKVAGSKTEFPLPAELDTLLREFIQWYHHHQEKLHPLELAALVHLKFVSIHPFSDGNGRTSRLLMNFVLHHYRYPMLNIKYSNRDSYYNSLERAQVKKLEKVFVMHIFKRYLKEYQKYI
ncbi:Fic family protein [Candidatus Woesearchaeota archaeon]|nr:Fic family protein [Candidatus Woesearchaeota archaeon]